jgi:hypothetical protein
MLMLQRSNAEFGTSTNQGVMPGTRFLVFRDKFRRWRFAAVVGFIPPMEHRPVHRQLTGRAGSRAHGRAFRRAPRGSGAANGQAPQLRRVFGAAARGYAMAFPLASIVFRRWAFPSCQAIIGQ